MTVADVLAALGEIAPSPMAFEWDKIGLQVGSPNSVITTGVTCLDLTLSHAQSLSPQTVVVAHHPLIWNPLTVIRTDQTQGAIVAELIKKDCCFIAAHTNWDAAPGGINDTLAARLGLRDCAPFGAASPAKLLKLVTFVPASQCETIFETAGQAGAGTIGEYRFCSFQSDGMGTFEGSAASQPAVGRPGKLERVPETRLEMLVPADRRAKVEAAIRKVHPYEEPALDWFTLAVGPGQSLGRIGYLPEKMTLAAFRDRVDQALGSRCQVTGSPSQIVHKVAVTGGAGGDEVHAAKRAGADVFLSGEIKHHELLAASSMQLATIEAGHYSTEHPGMESMRERLEAALPKIPWACLACEPGENGSSW